MTDLSKLMRDWIDTVARGPAEAWPSRAADGVVIYLPFAPPGVPKELRGIDQAVASLSGVWRAQERFNWHDVLIRKTEDPELLVTTARSEVILSPAQLYENTYVMLTRFKHDKVVEHVEYFNPLPAIQAFGLGEPNRT